MSSLKQGLIRAAFEALYFSGAHMLLSPLCRGVGAVFMLHHVRPPRFERFQPNRMLEIVPGFLEGVITMLRDAEVEWVSLDEMHRRLTERDFRRRFACITFDDGYRDNKEWAYPIFRRAASSVRHLRAVELPGSSRPAVVDYARAGDRQHQKPVLRDSATATPRVTCASVAEKREAFARCIGGCAACRRTTRGSASSPSWVARYGVDLGGAVRRAVHDLGRDRGACGRSAGHDRRPHRQPRHPVRISSDAAARIEMKTGRAVLQAALGKVPAHFSYPIGDTSAAGAREFRLAQETGYKTAVTTRPGVLFPQHAQHLAALPRLSINGEFQAPRYVQVLLSGTGTAVWNGFRRLNVA